VLLKPNQPNQPVILLLFWHAPLGVRSATTLYYYYYSLMSDIELELSFLLSLLE